MTDVSSDPVAALYESAGKLSSALTAGTIASATDAYTHLISSVSSTSDAVKQLAADTLPLYFHHFPAQSDAALSAYFDLIEDVNAGTRLRAIKGLETMAKNSVTLVPRLADVLAQLLVNDEEHERASVRSVFNALFALDSRACFGVLFAAIRDGDSDKLRSAAVEYLQSQLHKQWKAVMKKDASDELQTEIATGIKGVLAVEGLSEKDSRQLINKLMQLRVVKSDANTKADLAAIIASQAKLDKDFEPTSDESVDAFVSGLRAAHANKKFGVDSDAYLTYFSSKVLPVFDTIPASKRAVVIRQITNHVQGADAKLTRSLLEAVWTLTKSYLPATKTDTTAAADEASHDNYSTIESLLYLLHVLASAASSDAVRDVLGFFVATGQPSDTRADALKRDTLARLTQLSTAAQQWGETVAKELEAERTKQKEQKELSDDEKKVAGKRRAMLTGDVKIASSIAELIKPLTGKTHTFVTDAKLSWRGGKDDRKKDAQGGKDGKDGKRKGDGKQQQEAGQGGKKQQTGKEQSAAGGDGAEQKKRKGAETGGQQATATGNGASKKGGRGKEGQTGTGGQQQQQSQQQQQQQQDGRGRKRKSEGGDQQQPPQQQQQRQQQGQQGSNKRSRGNQPQLPAQQFAGAQQPNPMAYQQMAAAMMHNPQMMQAMAMQAMQMAAMQQQQGQQQPQSGNRRGGGGGGGGGRGGGGQQQQQPQQQQQRSQQGGKQGGGGGGGGGRGGGGGGGQKRKGRA